MNSLKSLIRRLSGRDAGRRPEPDPGLDRIVGSALSHADADGPDTGTQWARLEASIAREAGVANAGAGVANPARWKLSPRMQPGLVPRYAVGLAVILGIAFLAIFQLSKEEPRRVVTARGEQSVVTLPDDSEVLLNHTSSLDFEIMGFLTDRRVRLTGEAFFKVVRGDVPFIVVTDAGTVTVTGTKFNVRVRGGHYEVGVTEGSVRTLLPVPAGDTSIALGAGEAVSGLRSEHFPNVRRIEHSAYPGWNGRTLLFTRMDLWTVCNEVMDYFDVRIRLGDPAIGTLSVTGAFDAQDARNVITSICLLTGRQFRNEGGTYVIY